MTEAGLSRFNLCQFALQDGVFFKVAQRKAVKCSLKLFSKDTRLQRRYGIFLIKYSERKELELQIHILKPILQIPG